MNDNLFSSSLRNEIYGLISQPVLFKEDMQRIDQIVATEKLTEVYLLLLLKKLKERKRMKEMHKTRNVNILIKDIIQEAKHKGDPYGISQLMKFMWLIIGFCAAVFILCKFIQKVKARENVETVTDETFNEIVDEGILLIEPQQIIDLDKLSDEDIEEIVWGRVERQGESDIELEYELESDLIDLGQYGLLSEEPTTLHNLESIELIGGDSQNIDKLIGNISKELQNIMYLNNILNNFLTNASYKDILLKITLITNTITMYAEKSIRLANTDNINFEIMENITEKLKTMALNFIQQISEFMVQHSPISNSDISLIMESLTKEISNVIAYINIQKNLKN